MNRDLMVRSLLLGVATGARNSLGVAGPVLLAGGPGRSGPARVGRALVGLAVVAELVGDVRPRTPSRLLPPGPAARLVGGRIGALLLRWRRGADPAGRHRARLPGGPGLALAAEVTELIAPVLTGVAGAAAGTWGGSAWRAFAVRDGGPDWPGALAEDVVALAATVAACVPARRRAAVGAGR